MNAKLTHTIRRLVFSIMLSAGLLTAIAQPAAAHKIEFRPVVSKHYYYQHGRHFTFPRWLRKNQDFRRWYLRSDYRYIRGANWNTLYDMYLFEKRYQRRSHKHFHGKEYVDRDRQPRRRYR